MIYLTNPPQHQLLKSRENYKSPIPPRIININFENLPVINDSSKINTVKRGVIRLKKNGNK